ncbi:GTPase-activating protein [Neiella marina]|uniref:GTPase-activating protein n=1 Tax=Neiella holothuriorum TaxID=2870530 RepID=A0ABS7ECK7_9GAMM|nr:GTPase-activating protein [Neiella holothuriorum]MBW8190069.1 GTPase-activating protein [Neiella holothuriorum]
MTRIKKTRSGGPLGASKMQREGDSNVSKGKKVGKGNASGSRHSGNASSTSTHTSSKQDKRIGSTKPISLTAAVKPTPTQAVKETAASWPPSGDKAMQKALQAFEQDSQFMAQLDTLEQGGVLPSDDQAAFGEKLERYDWLLEQLAPEDDDDWDDLADQGKSLKDEWL